MMWTGSPFLKDAKAKRRNRFARGSTRSRSPPGVSAESFAQWIARRHLAVDPGIREVIYLPTDSPANEIRLLEVNAMLDGVQDGEAKAGEVEAGAKGIREGRTPVGSCFGTQSSGKMN
jgi:hypothetical protein